MALRLLVDAPGFEALEGYPVLHSGHGQRRVATLFPGGTPVEQSLTARAASVPCANLALCPLTRIVHRAV